MDEFWLDFWQNVEKKQQFLEFSSYQNSNAMNNFKMSFVSQNLSIEILMREILLVVTENYECRNRPES